MNHFRFFIIRTIAVVMVIASMPTLVPAGTEEATAPDGFTPLFNGEDLTGWRGRTGSPDESAQMSPQDRQSAQQAADENMRAHWTVADGVLTFDGGGDSLCTAKDYSDFELYVDWKIGPAGDSGIYLRGVPQVQIWDTTHEPLFRHGSEAGSGGLWNNQHHARMPLVKADRPVGEWNTFYIRMVGDRVTVRLNGELVVDDVVLENYWDRDQPIPQSGPIELQNHGDQLQFRNIFIRELDHQATSNTSKPDAPVSPTDGVIELFDGRSLDGLYTWIQGNGYSDPQQVFRVTDGMLHVTGDGMGGILTEKQYENYRMVLEYKWGKKTWADRTNNARDSGLLLHSTGADGGYGGIWMPAIEVQIIEGGVGDLIMVGGSDKVGQPVPISIVCEVDRDRDGERIWKRGATKEAFGPGNYHRINWSGRDPDWDDVLGFRGANDLESPLGEWTRLEVVCDGGHLQVFVNGTMVNEAFDVNPRSGKLQLQTELAEIYFRKWELWPLKETGGEVTRDKKQ
jgi:3-keto-disaccharide hydrolase